MTSKFLVLLQFTAIAALLWPWGAAAWNPWAWLPIALASALAAWAVASNPPTNFSIFPEPRANAQLITAGAYARLRHPMYAALGLFALGCAIGFNTPWHWLSGLALAAVDVIRFTPLLVQAVWIHFALPALTGQSMSAQLSIVNHQRLMCAPVCSVLCAPYK